jgi:hypothetical protein
MFGSMLSHKFFASAFSTDRHHFSMPLPMATRYARSFCWMPVLAKMPRTKCVVGSRCLSFQCTIGDYPISCHESILMLCCVCECSVFSLLCVMLPVVLAHSREQCDTLSLEFIVILLACIYFSCEGLLTFAFMYEALLPCFIMSHMCMCVYGVVLMHVSVCRVAGQRLYVLLTRAVLTARGCSWQQEPIRKLPTVCVVPLIHPICASC